MRIVPITEVNWKMIGSISMEQAYLLLLSAMLMVYGLGALIILFSFCWLICKTIVYAKQGDGLRSGYCGIFLILLITAMFSN